MLRMLWWFGVCIGFVPRVIFGVFACFRVRIDGGCVVVAFSGRNDGGKVEGFPVAADIGVGVGCG